MVFAKAKAVLEVKQKIKSLEGLCFEFLWNQNLSDWALL